VRDARLEGGEERRTRRDRDLAGRTRALTENALRIAAAILVDTLAFFIWNIAPRSPAQLLRDVATGMRSPGRFVRGLISFAVGLLLFAGSITLLIPLLLPQSALFVVAVWAMLTALIVNQLVAPSLAARRPAPAAGEPQHPE
jgi:hypothetical protein